MKTWEMKEEDFNRLLEWLDINRETAARKYESLHRRLVLFFDCRCCSESEDLADRTINRVMRHISDVVDSYVGEPTPLFYKVAHYVHLEYLDQRKKIDPTRPENLSISYLSINETDDEGEKQHSCLEACLLRLPIEKQKLILQYYREDKRAKIANRKVLGKVWGYSVNALRIQVYRIRAELYDCILQCLEKSTSSTLKGN